MNAQQKKEFIIELMDRNRDELLEKIPLMPEEWDGIELRQLIAEHMQRSVWDRGILHGSTRRGRAYRTAVLSNNL